MLWSSQIQLHTKTKMYEALLTPIFTWESTCWQLSTSNRKRIDTLEMDWSRRSCQVSRCEHVQNEDIGDEPVEYVQL